MIVVGRDVFIVVLFVGMRFDCWEYRFWGFCDCCFLVEGDGFVVMGEVFFRFDMVG